MCKLILINELKIFVYSFVVYINGQKIITDITANDGYWHFLCITWEGQFGTWKVYLDGFLKDNGTSLSNGTVIKGQNIFN